MSTKAKLPEGFTGIDKLPGLKKHGEVASSSEVVTFSLENGKTVVGRVQRWDRDMNAPHITAKKGDFVCHDLEGSVIPGVIGWK